MPNDSTPYTKLLIPEEPLQILPGLAAEIGVNEAIILQQLHYWLNPRRNVGEVHDGRRWVYNTYGQWQENFPFWSLRTIQGVILKLEKSGLIESTDAFNSDVRDRTKWYTINYEHPILCGEDANVAHSTRTQGLRAQDANVAHSTTRQRLPTETTAETISVGDALKIVLEQRFHDDFWPLYPRKAGKADALRAWLKLKPGNDLTIQIMEAVHAQCLHNWKGQDIQYIPHASTWLNNRRWEDEIVPHTNGRKIALYDKDGNFTVEGSIARARGEI